MTTQSIHILSTRPLPAGLIAHAAAQGLGLEILSFISTAPVLDEGTIRGIRELALKPLVAVFTSMNAVEAVRGWLMTPPGWKVFCIGSATRGLVADFFGEAAIAGTAGSAGMLAETVKGWEGFGGAGGAGPGGSFGDAGPREGADGMDREVYFFCGDRRREELSFLLRREGFTVNERVVYSTILTPRKVERVYDGIAFFSPSGVESYFSVNAVAESTRLFAIGETTAASIGAHCTNPVVISDSPEKEELVRRMIDYFQHKK
jgi:uroporphyrinogen-III synthase